MIVYDSSAVVSSLAAVASAIFAGLSWWYSRKTLALQASSLTFQIEWEADFSAGDGTLRVLLHNSGAYSAKIKAGEIRIHSYEHPEADITETLPRIEISATPREVSKIRVKHELVNQHRSEKFTAEMRCECTYASSSGEDKTVRSKYGYNVQKSQWEQVD